MNVLFGQRDAREQRLVCHAIVAVGIIRRDASLVAEKDVHLRPVEFTAQIFAREQFVDALRRRASGERHAETTSRFYALARDFDETKRGGACHVRRVGKDL
jgi:hypothetical protein